MRKTLILLAVIVIMAGSYSCVQVEGYGGGASISGNITTKYYNEDYSMLIREAPSVDEDVYLLFGDSDIIGDKVSTGPNGDFAFTFLRPGTYTVYFMSEDSSILGNDEEVNQFEIELAADEELDLGDLVELKTLDFDDGYASAFGVVKLINYKNTSQYPFLEVKDTSFAQEQEVYLVYGEHQYYDERIRTSFDGLFEFRNLIPGDYKVFVYKEDVTGGTENIPVIKEFTITGESDEIDLGTFMIEQL